MRSPPAGIKAGVRRLLTHESVIAAAAGEGAYSGVCASMVISTVMLDAKWLEALKLPLKTMLGIALSSGALLLLDLDVFGEMARPIVIAVCVVSSVLSLVGIVDLLLVPLRERQRQSRLSVRRAVRRKEEEERHVEAEAQVLARLDHLSKEEIRYVADCLHKGTPTFYSWVHSPAASMLMGKELVWTPGGTHHQDHYPFSFYDFVWKALLARKDEFIAKDEEHKRSEEAAKQAERRRRSY